jgi:hypothetical protein
MSNPRSVSDSARKTVHVRAKNSEHGGGFLSGLRFGGNSAKISVRDQFRSTEIASQTDAI